MPGALFFMRTPKPLRRLAYFPSRLEGLLRENAHAHGLGPVRGLNPGDVRRMERAKGFEPSRPKAANIQESRVLWCPENGAGEGIRTLDPDLGKVVLYP